MRPQRDSFPSPLLFVIAGGGVFFFRCIEFCFQMGPFVDGEHKAVGEGRMEMTFEEMLKKEIGERVRGVGYFMRGRVKSVIREIVQCYGEKLFMWEIFSFSKNFVDNFDEYIGHNSK